jgi:DNA-binding transcriptional ArsR family regulator
MHIYARKEAKSNPSPGYIHNLQRWLDDMSVKWEKAAEQCVSTLDTKFFKALCEPARVAVFRELVLLSRCDISTLSARLPQDRSVISRHLQVLADAGIVRAERSGRHILYSIALEEIVRRLEEMLEFTRMLKSIEK